MDKYSDLFRFFQNFYFWVFLFQVNTSDLGDVKNKKRVPSKEIDVYTKYNKMLNNLSHQNIQLGS